MKSFRRTISVVAMAFICVSSRAQPAPGPVKSPVALFRELLAMSPEERRDAIAIRPQEIQKRILEKLNEYELLPDGLRELRLRETELRWYLRPLMDEPQTNRPALLAKIPDELREEVASRLQVWDLVPEELQQQLKDNDLIASYFVATPEQRQEMLNQLSPERRDELEKGFDRWQKMSEADHQKAIGSFNRYFQLPSEQKEKMLTVLSDDERREMQKTLASYGHLTPQQRAQCISSFETFAGMKPAERQQFLVNAERWSKMTPEERQKWRQLVSVAPIMPQMNPPHQPASTNHSLLRDPSAVAAN
jgi:Spy/CpxP family protein refolding chaperone